MNLFYRKYGEGHPLVILHGLYGCSDNWVSVGRALSQHFEVYLLDQRNHGQSPHNDEHLYSAMCDDLLEFFDAQSLKTAILLGHSMGGKVAMNFAVKYPERVSSLIVADIAPKSYNLPNTIAHLDFHRNIISTLLNLNLHKMHNRDEIDTELSKTLQSAQVRQFLLKNVRRTKNAEKGNDIFEWTLNIKALSENLPALMEGLNSNGFSPAFTSGDYRFPVLFIRGEKSDYISNEDIPLIHKIFPAAEVVALPNAGHWLHAEQPELFVKTVQYFLGV